MSFQFSSFNEERKEKEEQDRRFWMRQDQLRELKRRFPDMTIQEALDTLKQEKEADGFGPKGY